MLRIRLLCSAFILSVLASCDSISKDEMYADVGIQHMASESVLQEKTDNAGNYSASRKLIKEGEIWFSTENLDAGEKAVKETIQATGGYISAEKSFENQNDHSRCLEVRVPIQKFDVFLAAISDKAGVIENKKITTEDVTLEYIDLEAHIRIKQELEARYVELLKQCTTMEAIIEMEKQLNEVRGQIETTQGRLNYLSDQTTFSTITIYLHTPDVIISDSPSFGSSILKSLLAGWQFILKLIVFLITIWPLYIFIFIAIVVYKRVRRRFVSSR